MLSLALESNGGDHSLEVQPGESKQLVDSNGIAAAEGSKQRAAGDSRERKQEEEKDSFHFSKGAYFIGKCVWGKVSLQELHSVSLQCPCMSCLCLPSHNSRCVGGRGDAGPAFE